MTDLQSTLIARMMEVCRKAGMRVTPQRQAIYEEVAKTEEHPDAETVFKRVRKRMPTVSLDTVYRTLSMLEEIGLVSRVEIFCERARFDANTDPHHHFMCARCGLVRDFQSETEKPVDVPAFVEEWGEIDAVHIQVRGVCAECIDRAQDGASE
jgi:Fur family transcriptional regulator, peroxide stress response regulator